MPEEHAHEEESGSELRKKIPFSDLMNIKETMNELFSDLFSGRPLRSLSTMEGWQPAVDIYENREFLFILVDIPGMKAKDIDISATPETIIIKGERRPEREVRDEDYILREHFYGHFSRSIALPCPVKPREIKATYKDGTLEIKLPKSKAGRGKGVRVDID